MEPLAFLAALITVWLDDRIAGLKRTVDPALDVNVAELRAAGGAQQETLQEAAAQRPSAIGFDTVSKKDAGTGIRLIVIKRFTQDVHHAFQRFQLFFIHSMVSNG